MPQDQINELLQALRCVTREHMKLIAEVRGYTEGEERSIVCINEALLLLRIHHYKPDNPL